MNWPEIKLGDWLVEQLPEGGVVGFDPWLHTPDEITKLEEICTPNAISLKPADNLVDRIWPDQPAPPQGRITPYPGGAGRGNPWCERARLAERCARRDSRLRSSPCLTVSHGCSTSVAPTSRVTRCRTVLPFYATTGMSRFSQTQPNPMTACWPISARRFACALLPPLCRRCTP